MDSLLETYLRWLRERWQVTVDPSGAEERPVADADSFRAFSPLGGAVEDPATEMTLRAIEQNPSLIRGRRVWEVGCGNGIVSVVCALAGAREVWASDVDPAAIEETRNLSERSRASVRVEEGSLLDVAAFPEPPEVLLVNLPQKPVEEGRLLRTWENGGPDGTRFLRPFLEQAQERLAGGGSILYLTHSLPHPSALRLLQAHFETRLLSWRLRRFRPGDYLRKLRREGSCWFEDDTFLLMQLLARRR